MKVNFNIKKVQISKISSYDPTTGLPTYATPLKNPGSTSLTINNEQSLEPFYADGVVYFTTNGATTITGTLENALFTRDVLKAIFAYIEDSNNNLLETDGAVSEFGLQFACDSDEGEVYFTYFKIRASKPGMNLQTSEGSPQINPQSIELTISPITLTSGQNIVKGYAVPGNPNYASYFDAITIPTVGGSTTPPNQTV